MKQPGSPPLLLVTLVIAGFSTGFAKGNSTFRTQAVKDTITVAAQDSIPYFMENEISIGIGAAYSPEMSMFNVAEDVAAGTNVGISIAYLRNLNEQIAVGINFYGYFKSIDNAPIIVNGNPKEYTLNVSTMNIGAECRYMFSRQKVRPYGFLVICYATGSLNNDELGSLRMNGFSGGGGAGADISLGMNWSLAIEGTASFGTAKWAQPPFSNSTGDDYNPTMYMGLVRISYLWE
jgi:hypothetical protein